MVVLEVLIMLDVSDCAADVFDVFDVSEAGPVEVDSEVMVVGTTIVVGVLFEVVATDVAVVRVVVEVDVLVDVGVVVDAVTTEVVAADDADADAPVPNVCLLWNIPSKIGISAVVEEVMRVRTAKARWAESSIVLLPVGKGLNEVPQRSSQWCSRTVQWCEGAELGPTIRWEVDDDYV
jgi:hypothetical protein